MELVIAISIAAVFVAFVGMFMTVPVNAYMSQSRRAELLDSAGAAWPRLERDLHAALPNSVRRSQNGSFKALEMLAVVDSARYMTPPAAPAINTAGVFRGIPHPFGPTAAGTYYVSINNLGTPGADAYELANAMTPANRSITIVSSAVAGEDVLSISPPYSFGADSPRHRAYLVSGPVTFLCDESQGTLRRYTGYSIAANQSSRNTPTALNGAGASNVLLARNISFCDFALTAGTADHGQIVTMRITASSGGESATMLHQAEVEKLQ